MYLYLVEISAHVNARLHTECTGFIIMYAVANSQTIPGCLYLASEFKFDVDSKDDPTATTWTEWCHPVAPFTNMV